jgi:hypothetical protein
MKAEGRVVQRGATAIRCRDAQPVTRQRLERWPAMTTIYLSKQQMSRLRKRVVDLKAEVPNITNSVIIF